LLLPARQFSREAVLEAGQADFIEEGGDPLPTDPLVLSPEEEDELGILPGGQDGYQVVGLEDKADPAQTDPGQGLRVETGQAFPLDDDLARVGDVEPADEVQESRLAAPRGARQGGEFPPPEDQADPRPPPGRLPPGSGTPG
jgi:hypothetical protein